MKPIICIARDSLCTICLILLFMLLHACGGGGQSSDQNAAVQASGLLSFRVQIVSTAKMANVPGDTLSAQVACDLTLTDTNQNELFTDQFVDTIQFNSKGVPLDGQIFEGATLDFSKLQLPQGCFTLDVSCVKQGTGFPFDLVMSWGGSGNFCSGKDIDTVLAVTNIFDLRNDPAIQRLAANIGCLSGGTIVKIADAQCQASTDFCTGCPEGSCVTLPGNIPVCMNANCPSLGGEGDKALRVSCTSDDACDALEGFLQESLSCQTSGDNTCCLKGDNSFSFSGFLCEKVLGPFSESIDKTCNPTPAPTPTPTSCKEGQSSCANGEVCPAGTFCEKGCCLPQKTVTP